MIPIELLPVGYRELADDEVILGHTQFCVYRGYGHEHPVSDPRPVSAKRIGYTRGFLLCQKGSHFLAESVHFLQKIDGVKIKYNLHPIFSQPLPLP